jgi:hypothetical protein
VAEAPLGGPADLAGDPLGAALPLMGVGGASGAAPAAGGRPRLRVALRAAVLLGAIGLLAFTFRHADLARVRQLLAHAPAL